MKICNCAGKCATNSKLKYGMGYEICWFYCLSLMCFHRAEILIVILNNYESSALQNFLMHQPGQTLLSLLVCIYLLEKGFVMQSTIFMSVFCKLGNRYACFWPGRSSTATAWSSENAFRLWCCRYGMIDCSLFNEIVGKVGLLEVLKKWSFH